MPPREIASSFLKNCLLLDLETSVSGEIFKIGAVLGESAFERKGCFDLKEALAALDEFGRDARFILGHNILSHDLPILASVWHESRLLGLPAIDTLYLSPLAFPENPYHRLVKDYNLVRDGRNHPVADARLAGALFLDQWESFSETPENSPELIGFFEFCFRDARMDGGCDTRGIRDLFRRIGSPVLPCADAAFSVFRRLTEGRVCEKQLKNPFGRFWKTRKAVRPFE